MDKKGKIRERTILNMTEREQFSGYSDTPLKKMLL